MASKTRNLEVRNIQDEFPPYVAMSLRVQFLYTYVVQAVFRRDWLCDGERLLPAGGSLAEVHKGDKVFWYKRFYDGGQHSEYLGEKGKVDELIKRERELMRRDAHIANYLLSMRNMNFPMPPIESQKVMRRLARAGFLKLDGVMRVDPGIVHSYAAERGDYKLAREANKAFKKAGILEFHVPDKSARQARKILKSLPEIPVKLVNAPDWVVENYELQVFLCVPGLAMTIPDPRDYSEWKNDPLARKLREALWP